jgi:hypothetical protein
LAFPFTPHTRGHDELNTKSLPKKGVVAMLNTIIGLLILIADIWAIVNVFQSGASTGKKVLWIIIILVFPVIGLVVWYFAGPKK